MAGRPPGRSRCKGWGNKGTRRASIQAGSSLPDANSNDLIDTPLPVAVDDTQPAAQPGGSVLPSLLLVDDVSSIAAALRPLAGGESFVKEATVGSNESLPRVDTPIFEPAQPESLLKRIARLLWLPSYTALFEAEYQANAKACGSPATGYALVPSTYRARLRGEKAAAYDSRRRRAHRDEMATALHANNMRHWSPSMLARSICYLKSTTNFVLGTETRYRRLASKPIVFKLLRYMRECKPPLSFEVNPQIAFFAADQTYEWVGMKKRGRRQTLEQHDARGMPVVITHEVYINSIQIHLPRSLGSLSLSDIDRINDNGGSPYTEDYNLILLPLQQTSVASSLIDFADDALGSVRAEHQRLRVLPRHQDHNPFWYSGNPVPLNTDDYRVRRPWEWFWRVNAGQVAGCGRARVESVSAFAMRMVKEHFFPY